MTMPKARIVFDRKGKTRKDENARAEVELCVYLSQGERMYKVVGRATRTEFDAGSAEYMEACREAGEIIKALQITGKALTAANYKKCEAGHGDECTAGITGERTKRGRPKKEPEKKETRHPAPEQASRPKAKRGRPAANVPTAAAVVEHKPINARSFLDFLWERIENSENAYDTKRQKRVAADELERFGGIKTFEDLTPENLKRFDMYLHDGKRSTVTIHGYHRRIKPYVREAYELGHIKQNPYDRIHFERGKSKERRPLSEADLQRLRRAFLPDYLQKARDVFLFCANTGLSYSDARRLDFDKMAEKNGELWYIDGRRLKTGTNFYTPILPEGLDILKKYKFHIPRLVLQVYNRQLHCIEQLAGLRVPLTSHGFRHTFATMALSKGVPIESISRMLGHTNIVTTQIYARILKKNVVRAAEMLL